MKILLIGGNGNISWQCAKEAIKRNHEVSIITRGLTWNTRREPHKQVNCIRMDINNHDDFKNLLASNHFDVISDFLSYDLQSTARRLEALANYKSSYVFISSTIIYERNESNLVLNENSKLRNIGFSPYVDGKLMVEKLINSNQEIAKRTLIIRPSHTFDTNVPTPLGSNCFTEVSRVFGGGNLLIPGDGMNKWTLMHSEDFSKVWAQLIEQKSSFGNAFNVVSDESRTWNEIAQDVLSVLDISPLRIKHVKVHDIESVQVSKDINLMNSNLGVNYSLHRKWNDQYDVSKLKAQLPGWACTRTFIDGFTETINWLRDNPRRQRINPTLLKALNNLDSITKL